MRRSALLTYSFLLCILLIFVNMVGDGADGDVGDTFTHDNYNYVVSSESPAFVSIMGSNDDNLSEIIIPESVIYQSKLYKVTSIGAESFKNRSNLDLISISKNIVSIGNSAFSGCKVSVLRYNAEMCADLSTQSTFGKISANSSLSIIIGDDVKRIPAYFCYNSHNLSGITFNRNVETIGNYAFFGCNSIISLDFSKTPLNIIGNYSFYQCTSLESIKLSDCIDTIGKYAFYDCRLLETIDLKKQNLTSIGEYSFYGCRSLESICIPSSVNELGSSAFYNCYSVTDIHYDTDCLKGKNLSGVFNSIGTSEDGTTVTFGELLTEIPDGLFHSSNYNNLISIIFEGNSLKKIGNRAFYNNAKLTSLQLPTSLESIGDYAFNHCKALTSITIPKNVKIIGTGAFADCSAISVIKYDAIDAYDLESTSTIFNQSNYYYAERTLLIGDGVEHIPSYYFSDRTANITSVTISASVDSIGQCAFYKNYSIESIVFLGLPNNWGENCLSLSYNSGFQSYNANVVVWSIVDDAFLDKYVDSNTVLTYKVLNHVSCDVGNVLDVDFPDEWVLYDGTLIRYFEMGDEVSLPILTSDKYYFDGWSPNVVSPMGDSTYHYDALWTKKPSYTVKYDVSGGTPIPDASVIVGTEIPLPNNVSRIGYTFNGWSIPNGTLMGNSDLIVIASWTINTVLVKFRSDGLVKSTISGKYGSDLLPPYVVKDGYTLKEWRGFTGKFPASSTIYDAVWEANTITVKFIDGNSLVNTSVGKCGSYLSAPHVKKDGFSLKWDGYNGKYPTADCTYEAIWTKIDGNIVYRNVYYYDDYGLPVFLQSYPVGGSIDDLEPPDKEGYVFEGWQEDIDIMPASNICLTPIWLPKESGLNIPLIVAGVTGVVAILAAIVIFVRKH